METEQPVIPQEPVAAYEKKGTNGLCIAALVISIIALPPIIVTIPFALLALILAIAGIIVARKKMQKGKGLGFAAIFLSIASIVLSVLLISCYSKQFEIEPNEPTLSIAEFVEVVQAAGYGIDKTSEAYLLGVEHGTRDAESLTRAKDEQIALKSFFGAKRAYEHDDKKLWINYIVGYIGVIRPGMLEQ